VEGDGTGCSKKVSWVPTQRAAQRVATDEGSATQAGATGAPAAPAAPRAAAGGKTRQSWTKTWTSDEMPGNLVKMESSSEGKMNSEMKGGVVEVDIKE